MLYVSDGSNVYVLALPKGNVVQTLTGFGEALGECVDARGDVFIVDQEQSVIREYAHGGKRPIKLLNDSGYMPIDCSVDPATGNLAVANFRRNIAIFAGAKGPVVYRSDPNIRSYYFCGYDAKGDLFVDGRPPRGGPALFAELPKGSTEFTDITLNKSVPNPGGIKWDGRYFAIAGGAAMIYRFKISGDSGKRVGIVPIDRSTGVYAFSIESGAVYVPGTFYKRFQHNVRVYAYPAGGRSLKSFIGFSGPAGAVVSRAK